jgi:UDP-glucose 4-epimerase
MFTRDGVWFMARTVLVTGGLGFIGSHTIVQLMAAGHRVVCLDNLVNSKRAVLRRIGAIAGALPQFVEGDIRDGSAVERALSSAPIDSVIHFAGLKSVGESVSDPMMYYDNNVTGTLNLLRVLSMTSIRQLIFSSSATVYGQPDRVPIDERAAVRPVNPYGRTKYFVEQMLTDLHCADPSWSVSILRYFNPVGAHHSGLIGEDPMGIPNNLLPYIAQVAVGRRKALSVFGRDYDTEDGTGVRDYIHVMDLADGHLAALDTHQGQAGCFTYNLGTGIGYSVLEMIKVFEKVSKRKVPFNDAPRRLGDIATCFADSSQAQAVLGWKPSRGLHTMVEDAWRWQSMNPNGLIQEDEASEI